jgi:adenylate kinase family enzyme
MKLLIIGNAGCGKTYLARKFKKKFKLKDPSIKLHHIDYIWFKPGGYSKKHERTAKERSAIIKKIKAQKNYIIEGASGITAKQFAKEATHLIFINYPVNVCVESIMNRTLDKGQVSSKEQTAWLVNFAKSYYKKPGTESVSLKTHKKIFDEFKGNKYYLVTRDDANRLCL